MNRTLLVLEGLNGSGLPYPTIDDVLKIDIEAMKTLIEARRHIISEHQKYFLLMTNPDNYLKDTTDLIQYKALLSHTKVSCHLPVFLFTRHTEQSLHNRYGIHKGEHFDDYLLNGRSTSPEQLKRIITKYLPRNRVSQD
jgi:hypothetical protein